MKMLIALMLTSVGLCVGIQNAETRGTATAHDVERKSLIAAMDPSTEAEACELTGERDLNPDVKELGNTGFLALQDEIERLRDDVSRENHRVRDLTEELRRLKQIDMKRHLEFSVFKNE